MAGSNHRVLIATSALQHLICSWFDVFCCILLILVVKRATGSIADADLLLTKLSL